MKKMILFVFVLIQLSVYSQQTDENTLAINNYFNISNENTAQKNPSNIDMNIKSYAQVVQSGNENSTYINSMQTDDQQVVNQKGNENNYEYYNYYSHENSNMIINQEGDKNSLQIFGENSLMKNATINQKSNFKSLVIKNYTN